MANVLTYDPVVTRVPPTTPLMITVGLRGIALYPQPAGVSVEHVTSF